MRDAEMEHVAERDHVAEMACHGNRAFGGEREQRFQRRRGRSGWVLPAIVVFLFVACLLTVYPW